MINPELLDTILLEWSYRLKDGIPDVNDSEKVKVLNEVLAEHELPLYEAEKGFQMPSEIKAAYFISTYYDAWLKKIESGESFLNTAGIEFKIPKTSDFYKKFKDSKGNVKKLLTLFKTPDGKYAPVIPGPGTEKLKLPDVSKKPFTLKVSAGGIQDLNTEDGKESLAAYFYACTKNQRKMVEDKLKGVGKAWTPLKSDLVSDVLLKKKGKDVVDAMVNFLNTTTTINKTKNETEIKACLQAISAARKMEELWGPGLVVDRNDGVFNEIQDAAASITGLSIKLIDKWCPGDVYMYKKGDTSKINTIVKQAKDNDAIVSVEKIVGLNSLFDDATQLVRAVSLKEAKAFAGAATSFMSTKDLPAGSVDVETEKPTDTDKKLLAAIIKAEREKKTVSNASKYIDIYETEHKENTSKLEKSIEKAAKGVDAKITLGSERQASKELNPNKRLAALINKNIAFRKMIDFFDKFKTIRDSFAKKYDSKAIKNYDNPLEALTAYGVSLSGFNPTFYKIQATEDGGPGHLDVFKGRDTLKIQSKEIIIEDAPAKAGYKIMYDSKMGSKTYKTTLDVRFKGELQITITVEEFKSEK
jgi:hypothetical protein